MVAEPYDPNFRANVTAVHGAAGVRWLADIPRLLGEIEQSWEVRVGPPYALSYNYVAPASTGSGTPCVVKLTVPDTAGLAREAAALRGFAGEGAVRLLANDPTLGALLLERAEPGLELAEFGPDRDGEATAVLCSVMQRLWSQPPIDHGLPSVPDYWWAFEEYTARFPRGGPLPQRIVDRAADLIDGLSDTADRSVLLHGDLHHHNVVQARREPWLAIDPHGLVGDPGFDVGPMLYNPMSMDAEQLRRLLPARVEQLADRTALGLDRVVAWGFVMAVLSEVWSTEDRGGIDGRGAIDGRPLAVAEALLERLR